MLSGVPAYQLGAHVALGVILFLAIIYAPLLMKRSPPAWALMVAAALAALLMGAALFAMFAGHWPLAGGALKAGL
jgi:hypothetical protein